MRWLVVVAASACGPEPGAEMEGSGGSSAGSETDASMDTDAPPAASSCPAPDPSLSAVPIGQAASTQAAYACMAWFGCTCDGARSVPSCRHGLAMTYEDIQEDALAAGLVYDGLCLAQHVADLEAIGCMADPEEGAYSVVGTGHCAVYHGTRALGDTCTPLEGGLSDCAQGLACWSGHCTDPCLSATPGGRCHDPFDFACAPGMVCVSDDCVVPPPPAPIGASCDEGGCVDEAWCRETCQDEACEYTCVARAVEGSPCTEDRHCVSDFCSEGACAVGPVTGEACVAERCLDGRECEAGVCGAPEGAICGVFSE